MYKAGRHKTHHIPYYHHDYHVSGNVIYPPANNAFGDHVQGEEMTYHTYDHVPLIRVDYSENDHYDSNRRRYHESHGPSHHHESPVYPDIFSEERHGGHKSKPLPSDRGRPMWMEHEHGGRAGELEAQVTFTPVEEHAHRGKHGHEARPESGYKDIYSYEDVDEVAVKFLRKEHELFEREARLSMEARR
ncbi:hypothetical protein H6P81_012872 [Aristolochia fimbriata]|uniref:Uncharacterized protein n=1 Tax=Aristolochia fimbriata TaxID=158543 RepID=A0AAV7EDM7_ARIFI|nr:hypothetical protein H6P81_012872 [Aristolochia fimbriata]